MGQAHEVQAQNELDNNKLLGTDGTGALKRLAAAKQAAAERKASAEQVAERQLAEAKERGEVVPSEVETEEKPEVKPEVKPGEAKLSHSTPPQGRSSKPTQRG